MAEKPTMETPAAQATGTPSEPATPNPHADLIAELEKFGVKSAGELQGKLAASQQVGSMANVLGEVRKENESLKQYIKEQMAQQRPAPAAKHDSWESEPAAGSIDLADLIDRKVQSGVKKVIDDEKRVAAQQQQKAWEAWNTITNDEDYHLVKDKWESKLKDPNFALKFQSGAVDPIKEYQELVRGTYKSAVSRSAEIIKSLTTGAGPPKVHVEGGARSSGIETRETPEKDKTLNPLREKINKGKSLSEQEELDALMKVLGGKG